MNPGGTDTESRTVGQLRYAAGDAVLPLLPALTVALLAGLPPRAAAVAAAAGLAVAGWRMRPYLRDVIDHRRNAP